MNDSVFNNNCSVYLLLTKKGGFQKQKFALGRWGLKCDVIFRVGYLTFCDNGERG